jgi:hypothetical protein
VTKKLGEDDGLLACGGHERILARDSGPSWNARIRALARDRDAPSRTLGRLLGTRAPQPGASRGPASADSAGRNASRSEPRQLPRRVGCHQSWITGAAPVRPRTAGEPGHAETVPARGAASAAASPSLPPHPVARTVPPRRLHGAARR